MKKSVIKNLIYCVIMVLLFTGIGFAANTLEVKCVDENGQAVQKAKVLAFALQNGKTSNKKTNKEGIAFFNKMKDDYYRIWVEAKGYKKELKEFIPLLNDTQSKIEFKLIAGDAKAPLYFEDNLIRERADSVFPEPDSPTIPTVCPCSMEKLTLSTAGDPLLTKETLRFWISIRFVLNQKSFLYKSPICFRGSSWIL